MRLLGGLLLSSMLAAGCAHRRPEPLRLEGLIVTPGEVVDAPTLFERARSALEQRRFAEAAKGFDTLVASFETSPLVLPSLYNAGLAHEGLRDWATAADRYRRVEAQFPETSDAIDARFRLGACFAELKRWLESVEVYRGLLETDRLSPADRLEAMVRRGYGELEQQHVEQAERLLRDSLAWAEAHEAEERMNPFFLAMVHYYLGQIAQARYRAVVLRAPEKEMAEDLERKAQLLLVAQARYVRAVEVGQADWASAAGYQIAGLYRSFHDAIEQAPIPQELARSPELLEIYRQELKRKLRPLLEKAVRTHEQSLLMAERAGVRNEWVARSRQELEALRKLLLDEETERKEEPRGDRGTNLHRAPA